MYGKDTSNNAGQQSGRALRPGRDNDDLRRMAQEAYDPHDPKADPRVPPPKLDPVVEAVRADLHRRSQLGVTKYGTTLADNKGNQRYWLNHAYEEALDLANYLKRQIMALDGEIADYPVAEHPAAGNGLRDCNAD